MEIPSVHGVRLALSTKCNYRQGHPAAKCCWNTMRTYLLTKVKTDTLQRHTHGTKPSSQLKSNYLNELAKCLFHHEETKTGKTCQGRLRATIGGTATRPALPSFFFSVTPSIQPVCSPRFRLRSLFSRFLPASASAP